MRRSRRQIAISLSLATSLSLIGLSSRAIAQDVLYTFNGPEKTSAFPHGTLIRDSTGALFGTTFGATLLSDPCLCVGAGAVYKLTPQSGGTWTYTVLHAFPYAAGPYAGVISDSSGALYGTTYKGGATDNGTVFKLIPPNWNLQLLHEFSGADGSNPYAGLIWGPDGWLWGSTRYGGTSGNGTLFRLKPPPTVAFRIIHSFTGGADGENPAAGLTLGARGTVYGCTTRGGGPTNAGTIFVATDDTVTTLFTFNGTDGTGCSDSLVKDSTGALYGTTAAGGSTTFGTVFKLAPPTWTHTILHNFNPTTDGANPWGSMIFAPNGDLYGTTDSGGAGAQGNGTVYKLAAPSWNFTAHSLQDPLRNPEGGLMYYSQGALVGTTYHGGASHYGNVFRVPVF
jgi:uncharacterized repeat protein (TIGR03803 family)